MHINKFDPGASTTCTRDSRAADWMAGLRQRVADLDVSIDKRYARTVRPRAQKALDPATPGWLRPIVTTPIKRPRPRYHLEDVTQSYAQRGG